MGESHLKLLNHELGFDEPEPDQPDQELAPAVHLLVNEDPSLTEKDVLDRIELRNLHRKFPVEGMTEEMAEVIKDTIRVQDQEPIVAKLRAAAPGPPAKVAELPKKAIIRLTTNLAQTGSMPRKKRYLRKRLPRQRREKSRRRR